MSTVWWVRSTSWTWQAANVKIWRRRAVTDCGSVSHIHTGLSVMTMGRFQCIVLFSSLWWKIRKYIPPRTLQFDVLGILLNTWYFIHLFEFLVRPNAIACGADLSFSPDVLFYFFPSARSQRWVGRPAWNFARWSELGRIFNAGPKFWGAHPERI